MSTTVNVLCYKSKVLKNGESPLMLCVSKDRKRKYQSLGISVNPVFWDFEKNKPKANCPNREQILRLIAEQTKAFSEQILEYKAIDKDFTAKTLLEKVKNPTNPKTVKEVFDIQIKRLQDAKRLRYAEMHLLVLNSLIKFNGHLDIYF
ncbi:MAG: site-specific integrase, partial [Dysgonamonadaceae bacterium]|nr:site-specific integrase [Dysgonamonadaceae bacterium]